MKLIPLSIIALSAVFLTNCNERKQAVEDQKDATKEALEKEKDALKPAADAAVSRVEANADIQKAIERTRDLLHIKKVQELRM